MEDGREREEDTMKIFYLCDRRACEKCHDECEHTNDIRHAVSFELTPNGNMYEREPEVVLISETSGKDDTQHHEGSVNGT